MIKLLLAGTVSLLGLISASALSYGQTAPNASSASDLRHVAKKLNKAREIEFTADYQIYSKGALTQSYTIQGDMARPNVARISVWPAGAAASAPPAALLVSDGKVMTAASAGKAQYIQATAPKEGLDPDSTEAMYFIYDELGGPGIAAENTADSLLPADYDISAEKVPAGIQRTVTTTSSMVTLGGKQYHDIVQKVAGVRHTVEYHTVFDPQTYTLAALDSYSDDSGTPQLTEHMGFTTLTLHDDAPAKREQFAFAPASGMSLYHAAASVGTPAPNFSVQSLDGKTISLADYKGKVVVIDFWATWCPPCLKTLPTTDKLAAKYQPQGVVFLPVCTWDTKARFDEWVPKHSKWTMTWLFDPAADDEDKSIAQTQYAVAGIPAQYVIGKDGKIVYRGFADSDAGEAPLINAIKAAVSAS